MTLKDLPVGQMARITGYSKACPAYYRQKLLSIGLVPNTMVKIRGVAPMGDPLHLEVRGYNLTLRRLEAQVVEVELCPASF